MVQDPVNLEADPSKDRRRVPAEQTSVGGDSDDNQVSGVIHGNERSWKEATRQHQNLPPSQNFKSDLNVAVMAWCEMFFIKTFTALFVDLFFPYFLEHC